MLGRYSEYILQRSNVAHFRQQEIYSCFFQNHQLFQNSAEILFPYLKKVKTYFIMNIPGIVILPTKICIPSLRNTPSVPFSKYKYRFNIYKLLEAITQRLNMDIHV